jgi:hypothetical protein|tara:strand:- start:822 stop:1049 length:228 start_codon:yes stop_codon:yes gene_type:complete
MSLLNKLISGQASATSLSGQTPNTPNFQQSTLHKDYSTIGNPNASQVEPNNGVLPQPSTLEGPVAPTRYLDNLPG